jgi:FlaA1/EpsC-like NDP-sugar epimerase
MFAMDFILLSLAWYGAFLVRFDFDIPSQYVFALIIITKMISFYLFDIYRGMWRYTSIADLLNIIRATSIATLFVVGVVFLFTRFYNVPRSVFVIDWCLTILLIAGYRLGIRIFFDLQREEKPLKNVVKTLLFSVRRTHPDSRNLLIIGGGDGGEKIYREIRDNAGLRYNVVGFLDDDRNKVGMKIHGIPILGFINDLEKIARSRKADEVLIAIPSASSQQMRSIIEHCKGSGIAFKTIPGMGELIDGKVTVNAIREVAYRDLLGREMVQLDEVRIGDYLADKSVLITGAGGSIGSELCRQICRFRPKSVALYERAESPLYELDIELKRNFPDIEIVPLLADVRDRRQLEKAFEASRPHSVFHAAAYKHVPILELQPWKAIKNNVQGTRNVVEYAHEFGVERFVYVSTDKAVRPVNIMGTSKRVAEMLVQGQNGCGLSDTRYMIVRFGNVAGSVGSVVPLFKKQIEKGGPVTVTHPEITRYFMTIPEACQLILQAGAMGEGGEIFILDMGTPIKIDDMARDLISLSGFEPDVDIKIEYIGLRPGEKLYEELITEGEGIVPTSHEKIMVLSGTECNMDLLNGGIDKLARLAYEQDSQKIRDKLQEIVPEYRPVESGNGGGTSNMTGEG